MTQNLKNILIAAGFAFSPMIIADEAEGTQSTSVLSQPGKVQSNARATQSDSALSGPSLLESDNMSFVSPDDDFDNIPDERTYTPNWSTSAILSPDDDFDNIPDEDSYDPNWNSTGALISPDDDWYNTHNADIDSVADKDEESEERKSTNTTETYVSYRSGLNGNIAAVRNDREIELSSDIADAQGIDKAVPSSWNSESTLSKPEKSWNDTRSTGMLVSPKEFWDPSYPLTFESRNNK